MSDQVQLKEGTKTLEVSSGEAVEPVAQGEICQIQKKGWLKGPLGMAICCGAPLLLVAAVSFFGLSLGALASGALSLVAVLACPVGMFLMMRMMMKDKKQDQPSRK